MSSFSKYQLLRKKSLFLPLFLLLFTFACNRFNQSYNEIPKLPPANKDFSKDHLEVLNTLIEEDDENDELYWQRSIIYQRLGRLKESLDDIKTAIRLDDEKYHYYKTLAGAYLVNGKYDSAITAANYSRNSGNDDYQLNLILAEAYIKQGKVKESMSEIDEALQIDSNYYYTYYLRGLAYKTLGDSVKYQSNFQKALRLNPNDKDTYQELFNFYLASGRVGAAKEILDKLFSSFTPDIEMLSQKADFYEKENKLDSAYKYYYQAYEQDSSQHDLSLQLGNVKLKQKDFITARTHFEKVLSLKNNNFQAQYKLAICYESLRNLQQASMEYQKALELDTANQVVKNDIARVTGKIKQRQEQQRINQENERRVILLPEIPNIN